MIGGGKAESVRHAGRSATGFSPPATRSAPLANGVAEGYGRSLTGTFTNNGVLDLLTGAHSLPANLVNNGIIIDSSSLRMTSAVKAGSAVTVTAQTYAPHTYQLQRADSLTAPVWGDIAGQSFADDGSAPRSPRSAPR